MKHQRQSHIIRATRPVSEAVGREVVEDPTNDSPKSIGTGNVEDPRRKQREPHEIAVPEIGTAGALNREADCREVRKPDPIKQQATDR